jgi:hypothetical protein
MLTFDKETLSSSSQIVAQMKVPKMKARHLINANL